MKTPREPLFGEGFLEVARPSGHFSLSFPKIISGRIGGAVQPGWKWWQWRPIVGPLDAKAHLSRRIANIALNDAMILPYDANPGRM